MRIEYHSVLISFAECGRLIGLYVDIENGMFITSRSARSGAVSKPHFHHVSVGSAVVSPSHADANATEARVQHEAGDAPSTGPQLCHKKASLFDSTYLTYTFNILDVI